VNAPPGLLTFAGSIIFGHIREKQEINHFFQNIQLPRLLNTFVFRKCVKKSKMREKNTFLHSFMKDARKKVKMHEKQSFFKLFFLFFSHFPRKRKLHVY
jgi:hypothetical protein